MKAGLYEARSLIVDKTAYVVLDDAAELRRRLHRARRTLQLVRWHTSLRMRHVIAAALRDVEEGCDGLREVSRRQGRRGDRAGTVRGVTGSAE